MAFLCTGTFSIADEPMVEQARKGRFFALPMELDLDSGAANGNAAILRMLPLYIAPVTDRWKLVNLNIVTLADAPSGLPTSPDFPEVGGKSSFGLSDLMHGSFYTPTYGSDDFVWGLGALASIPTATDDTLGTGKWTAGPAFRVRYRTGAWNLGLIAGQRWSFAGSGDREEVSQLLMRGAIRRQLPNDWYFVSAPMIVANWKATGERWLVPLGGGIGRRFSIASNPWAFSVQGYYNAVKPDTAPDWTVRLAIVAAIPLGAR